MPTTKTSNPTFVPYDGVFAILQIDPVASVAYLDDPEALEAATALTFNEYLVFVPGTHELRHPAIACRAELVDFVVQGLPMRVPELAIESSMSIPIRSSPPNTPHPEGRAPLELYDNKQLPWADCYLASFLSTIVRCATVISDDDPIRFAVDGEERYRRKVFVDRDRIRQAAAHGKLLAPAASGRAESEFTSIASAVSDASSLSESQSNVAADGLPVSDSLGFDPRQAELDGLTTEELQELEDQEEEQFLHDLLTPREAPDELIAVTFTHDVSRLDGRDLTNGGLFFVEKQNLMQIVEESFARKRKAVENEADAMFAGKTAPRLAAHSEKAVETGPSIDGETGEERGWLQKKLALFRRVFLCGRGAV